MAILQVTGLTKSFPGTLALDDVSLELDGGEVLAVVGHNGSGKSTFVKILAGIHNADAGHVNTATHDDGDTEIHVIHQDLGLVAELTAVENLGLRGARGAVGFAPFRRRDERRRARELIGRFGEEFDVTVPVAQLSPAQRAIIAIARALDGWTHRRNVLVLDEPTEALHSSEVALLFEAVRRIAADGAGVIFISHRLDEVLDLAHRVVVLRDGRTVADEIRGALDHDRLVDLVTGGPGVPVAARQRREQSGDTPVLQVNGLRGPGIDGFDLVMHPHQIVGVAGVLGSGREALPSLLFGVIDGEADRYEVAGEAYDNRHPAASIRRGIAFLAGDRSRYGAIDRFSAAENMTLPALDDLRSAVGAIDRRRERAEVQELMMTYDVRPARPDQTFSFFSGGNQQKIVFAKWMRTDPKVLLLEEPTRGVDIGAKQSIYAAIDHAAGRGAAIVVCSSDAKELVRLCDRVLVMRSGRVASELAGDDLSEADLILAGYGLGGDDHDRNGAQR